jgi:hypothetical protein
MHRFGEVFRRRMSLLAPQTLAATRMGGAGPRVVNHAEVR